MGFHAHKDTPASIRSYFLFVLLHKYRGQGSSPLSLYSFRNKMNKSSQFFTFQQLIILCCFATLSLRASCSANSLLCRHDVSLHHHMKAYTNGNWKQSCDSLTTTSTSRLPNRHLFYNVNNAIIADAMRKNRPEPIVEMIEVCNLFFNSMSTVEEKDCYCHEMESFNLYYILFQNLLLLCNHGSPFHQELPRT